MDLVTFVGRPERPDHGVGAGRDDWARWAKIPWDDPDFSRRMLAGHLSQDHDWASRKNGAIARQVASIHARLPRGARILDLGCGPGLYTEALHALGHPCTGVDFSPASIEYARKLPGAAGITYVLGDIRLFKAEETFDAVLLLFGEINAFSRDEAADILRNAARCLAPGGTLFVEVHTAEAVRAAASGPPTWLRQRAGLFSDAPHLLLEERFWNEAIRAAMTRFAVIDAATASVTEYATFLQAYEESEYQECFRRAGFGTVNRLPAADWPEGEDFTGKLFCFACGR